jgi:dienelactone hydrolase
MSNLNERDLRMRTPRRCHASLTATLAGSMAAGVAVLLLGMSIAAAEVVSEEIRYQVGDKEFTGYLAYDDAVEGTRPGVLVVHEWWGLNDHARNRTEMLAAEGYTAFALDMYGSGRTADHPEGAQAFTQEVLADLSQAEQRFNAAKDLLRQHETVKPDSIAAIGFCFGGGVVLHMARTGADLDGVVSFHGTLAARAEAEPDAVTAEVLVFNGDADPFVPPEQVQEFIAEMQAANVRYQLVGYPGVQHSFTNPDADEVGARFGMPLAYDREADADSWQQMLAFFDRLFEGEARPAD